ncbi:hypothetical protein SIID45300_01808 [Candidatus Magnetaquicoccaceae bacterium FCR-1]|uniref:General secretion pathway protein J n=1 Tax=Candidatus Magnetaquiglobus chichijimensis TaxID=3141448 RepID=A0ABQ0C9B7_9PROT
MAGIVKPDARQGGLPPDGGPTARESRSARAGFTLIEALIALSIAALIMTGVYQTVRSGAARTRLLEERAETVHLWNHLKRVIRRDIEHLEKEPPARLIREGKELLVLRCRGDLVPEWRMGPRVEVLYRWRSKVEETGMIWERAILPAGRNREEAVVTLTIDKNLDELAYDLLDPQEWRPFGEGAQTPWKALRWRFTWKDIGPWNLIVNLTPMPVIQPRVQP